MERNQLIILIIGIIIAVFVGGTLVLTLLYGEHRHNRLAEIGDIDEELKKDYLSEHKNKVLNWTIKGVGVAISLAFIAFFTICTIQRIQGERFSFGGQDMYVVRSGSMNKANPQNPDYDRIKLYKDRFDVFDIVFVKDKPKEELDDQGEPNLKIGQIIMYKANDRFIIHRLSKIYKPGEWSGDGYGYVCCGDANRSCDAAVTYNEIEAVYTEHKIPFAGVFILWMQSTLGYVVVGIILVYAVFSSYLERKANEYTINRLVEIQYLIPYENRFGHTKYKINPNPPKFIKEDDENGEDAIVKGVTRYRHKVYVVSLSRFDIVNVERLNKYNFDNPTKSVYKCHHFHTLRIKCLNTNYICVKVWFRCNNATIIKYLFFNRIKNFKYRPMALKQVHYLIHSGRLNNYIKLQLDLMEEKNANK